MQIVNATGSLLRLVQGLQTVAAVLGACALAVACGERFQQAEPKDVVGGAGSGAGPTEGGEPPVEGGAGPGGASAGVVSAGKGGLPPVGGMGGASGVAGALAGGAGVGGAEPPQLPVSPEGLEFWFAADQGVTQNEGVVTIWKDLSVNHRNATQTSLNSRPKLVADALEGKPGLVFDGGDFMKMPALPTDFSGGLSMFAVVLPSQPPPSEESPLGCQGYFEAANGVEEQDIHLGDYRGSLLFEVDSNFLNDLNFPLPFDAPHLVSTILRDDAWLEMRRNSSLVGETSFVFPPVMDRSQVYIGRTLYLNCTSYKGVLSELMLFSRPLADEELLAMEEYLQSKWGCCSN
jgi:hypothetical protein